MSNHPTPEPAGEARAWGSLYHSRSAECRALRRRVEQLQAVIGRQNVQIDDLHAQLIRQSEEIEGLLDALEYNRETEDRKAEVMAARAGTGTVELVNGEAHS